MVSISVRPKRSARHIDDGDIVLTNGRVTLLDDISGNTWTRSRLRRLAAAVQGRMDHRRLIADLRDIDPDTAHAAPGAEAWVTARSAGRQIPVLRGTLAGSWPAAWPPTARAH